MTPLHYACLNCEDPKKVIITFLIKNGADVNVLNVDNESPLDYACKNKNNIKIIMKLVDEFGAKIKNTTIKNAIQNNNYDTLTYLIDYYKVTNKLIRYAIKADDNKLLEILLIYTTRKIINQPNIEEKYQTALILSCAHCNFEAVKLLIEFGADINKKDSNNNTALHVVMKKQKDKDKILPCYKNILKYLLHQGAKTNIVNNSNKPARDYNPEIFDEIEHEFSKTN
jgi:ankyrin repeat protein